MSATPQKDEVQPYQVATGAATPADVDRQEEVQIDIPAGLDADSIARDLEGDPAFFTRKDYAAGLMPTEEQIRNASRYREARDIAVATGLPIDWVAEHLDEARRAWAAGPDKLELMAARHPELAKWTFRNLDYVGDDLAALSGLSWLGKATIREWQDGQLQLELGKLRAKQAVGLGSAKDELRIVQIKDELDRRQRDPYYGAKSMIAKGWLDFANMAPMTWDAMWHSVAGAALAYPVGWVVGATGALIAGQMGPQAATPEEVVTVPAAGHEMGVLFSTWGGRLGAFFSAAQIEGGLAYDELLEMGADRYTARGLAGIVGAINGALELVELEGLLRIARGGRFFKGPVSREARQAVLEALEQGEKINLRDKVTRDVLRGLVRDRKFTGRIRQFMARYGEAAITETITEVLQEGTNILADHLAAYLDENAKAAGWDEEFRRLADIAIVTARSMLVGGAVYPVPGFIIDTAHAAENAQKVQDLEKVIALFEALESGKDSPALLEEIAKVLKEDLPEDTVYVDKKAWDTYWQEQGEDPREKAQELTGQEGAYEQAEATGDVAIPIERYIGHLANTDHHVALMEHVRLHPGAVTMAEAREIDQDEARRQAELAEAEADRAKLTEREELEVEIANQLVAAGLSKGAAETNARIVGAFFAAFARRVGKSIRELWTAGGKAPQGRFRVVTTPPGATAADRLTLREKTNPELLAKLNERLGKLVEEEQELRKKAAAGELTKEEAARLIEIQVQRVQLARKIAAEEEEAAAAKGQEKPGEGFYEQRYETREAGTDPTATPEFRAWFGRSQVVDENGDPLMVWHGSPNAGFRIFSAEHRGSNTGAESGRLGFWFAEDPEHAADYVFMSETGEYWVTSPPWRYILGQFEFISEELRMFAEDIEKIAKTDERVAAAVQEFRDWAESEVGYLFKNRLSWKFEKKESFDDVPLEQVIEAVSSVYNGFIEDAADYRGIEDYQPVRRGDSYLDMGIAAAPDMLVKVAESLRGHEEELDGLRVDALVQAAESIGEAMQPVDLEALQKDLRLRAFYLRIENPYVVKDASWGGGEFSRHLREAKARGHDGVIFLNVVDGPQVGDHYVVFSPEQIKAVDNVGTFRRDTPDVYLQEDEQVPYHVRVAELIEQHARQLYESIQEPREETRPEGALRAGENIQAAAIGLAVAHIIRRSDNADPDVFYVAVPDDPEHPLHPANLRNGQFSCGETPPWESPAQAFTNPLALAAHYRATREEKPAIVMKVRATGTIVYPKHDEERYHESMAAGYRLQGFQVIQVAKPGPDGKSALEAVERDELNALEQMIGTPVAEMHAGIARVLLDSGMDWAAAQTIADRVMREVADDESLGKLKDALEQHGGNIRDAMFRMWFGDSKVVDANGEPRVVYHGTFWKSLERFDPEKRGELTKAPSARAGFFFAGDPRTSVWYVLGSANEAAAKEGVASRFREMYYDLDRTVFGVLGERGLAALKVVEKYADALRKTPESAKHIEKVVSRAIWLLDQIGLEGRIRKAYVDWMLDELEINPELRQQYATAMMKIREERIRSSILPPSMRKQPDPIPADVSEWSWEEWNDFDTVLEKEGIKDDMTAALAMLKRGDMSPFEAIADAFRKWVEEDRGGPDRLPRMDVVISALRDLVYETGKAIAATATDIEVAIQEAGQAGLPGAKERLAAVDELFSASTKELRPSIDELWGGIADALVEKGFIIRAYLKIENPHVYDYRGDHYREESYKSNIDRALKDGRDGVILKNTFDGGPLDDIFVVFEPNQIKAVENRGSFDPYLDGIYFQEEDALEGEGMTNTPQYVAERQAMMDQLDIDNLGLYSVAVRTVKQMSFKRMPWVDILRGLKKSVKPREWYEMGLDLALAKEEERIKLGEKPEKVTKEEALRRLQDERLRLREVHFGTRDPVRLAAMDEDETVVRGEAIEAGEVFDGPDSLAAAWGDIDWEGNQEQPAEPKEEFILDEMIASAKQGLNALVEDLSDDLAENLIDEAIWHAEDTVASIEEGEEDRELAGELAETLLSYLVEDYGFMAPSAASKVAYRITGYTDVLVESMNEDAKILGALLNAAIYDRFYRFHSGEASVAERFQGELKEGSVIDWDDVEALKGKLAEKIASGATADEIRDMLLESLQDGLSGAIWKQLEDSNTVEDLARTISQDRASSMPEEVVRAWADKYWDDIQRGWYNLYIYDPDREVSVSEAEGLDESPESIPLVSMGVPKWVDYSLTHHLTRGFTDSRTTEKLVKLGWSLEGYGELVYEIKNPAPPPVRELSDIAKDVVSAPEPHWGDFDEIVRTSRILFHTRYTTIRERDRRIFVVEEVQSDMHTALRDAFEEAKIEATDRQIDEIVGRWMRLRKNTWVATAIRRAFLLAAEAGFDEFRWTTAETQAVRWSTAMRGAIKTITWGPPGELAEGSVEQLVRAALNGVQKNDERLIEAMRRVREGSARVIDVAMRGSFGMHRVSFIEGYEPDPENKPGPSARFQPLSKLKKYLGRDLAERLMAQEKGTIEGEEIIIGTAGYDIVYDSVAKKAIQKVTKKFDPTAQIRKQEDDIGWTVPFRTWAVPITDKIREGVSEGLPLYQKGKKDAKVYGYMRRTGKATFDIGILRTDNLSTFIHEFAHFAFEFMGDLVEAGEASEDVVRDYKRLLKFAGVRNRQEIADKIAELTKRLDAGEITREEFRRLHPHERIAKAFEIYMSEGKAPSRRLGGVFQRIKMWMIEVYGEAKKALGIEINDEIREVFDRWLATEQAIQAAKEETDLAKLAKFAALAGGMTKEEAERYHRLVEEAEEAARREVAQEVMAEIKRAEEERLRRVREEVKAKVEREFYQDRAWRAIYYLQNGKMPPGFEGDEPSERLVLSKDAIVESYGEDMLARLPKPAVYRREGGVHPDEVAPLFGFASGHEMLEAMAAKEEPRGKALKKAIDQAVEERLGKEKVSTPEELAEAARKAVNGDAMGRVFLAQLRRLASLAGRMLTPRRVFRENAERIVAQMRVTDLHPERFLRARQKATREMHAAMAVQDWARAWEAAERQARLHELYMAARRAQTAAGKVQRRINSLLSKKGLERLGRAGAEYVDQFLALVERFDFANIPAKAIQKRISLREFIEEEKKAGRDLVIPERIQEEAYRKNWREMTLEELRGLDDAVRSLENQARLKRRLKLWKQEMDEDEAARVLIEELKANLKDLGPRPFDPNTIKALRRSIEKAKRINASLLKPEAILDWFDGKQEGPWHLLIFQTIAEAQRREDDLMAEYAAKLVNLAAMLPDNAKERLDQQIYIKSLGQNVTIRTIIGIALNTGNESNLRKMMLGGFLDLDDERKPLTEEMLTEMLGHLTEQEWHFVQAAWDTIESLWPMIEEMERRLTGVAPKKILPSPPPFQLPNMPKGLRGGYWPIAYDPDTGARSTQLDEIQNIAQMFEQGFARAATPHGHLIERIENYARPLTFNWEWIMSRHLSQVIHDLTHREAVINVLRLLMREDVAGTIRRYAGNAYYKALKAWVYNVANEQVFAEDDNARWWFNFTNKLRSNVSVAVMGFKVTTMLSQFAGFAASLEMVPVKYMRRATVALTKDFSAMVEFMHENSTEMKHRAENLERDIRDLIKSGQLSPGRVVKGVRKAAMAGIAYADLMVTVPTWHAAYMQEMDRSGDHDKAVAYADKVVRLTQGAGGIKDLSPIQRSRYLKLVTMFYSYFAALYSRMESWATDVPDIVRRRAWLELPHWVMRGIYMIVLPAILSEILSGRVPDKDDDESWAKWAAAKVATYPMQTIPLMRDLAGIAEALVKGKRPRFGYRFTPIEDLGQKIGLAAASTARAIWGEEDWGKAIARDAEAIGIAVGLPTAQVKGTWRQLNKYWRGEKGDAGWGQFIYELLYGRDLPEPAPLVSEED